MLQPAHIDAIEDYLADLSAETAVALKATNTAGTGFYA
jgi:hypothetical protein